MSVPVSIDDHVDVVAVTGFLGAGKTTLIKALLECDSSAGVAVLVSELGEIGIDDAILADAGYGVVELQNGCICCRVGGGLEQTLRDLLVARLRGHVSPFRRLFIETSGISDPADVIAAMHSRPMRELRYRMLGTVVAFDGQFGSTSLRENPEAGAQLAAADCVALTKCDIGAPDESGIAELVSACSPGAPILRSIRGFDDEARPVLKRVGSSVALTPAASAFRAVTAGPPAIARHIGVRSVSVVLDGSLDWSRFVAAIEGLASRQDATLLRVKGILSVAGIDAAVVAHGVRDVLYPPVQLREWPFPLRESRIVLIYTGGEADMFGSAAKLALAEAAVSRPNKEEAHAA